MRSGVTRETLRREVQIEAGQSTDPGHSIQTTERINHKLNQVERRMALAHTWPMLNIEEDVTIAANAQYGSLPTGITFTMISQVWCQVGQSWLPVTHGIGIMERSSFTDDQRSSPISRWEIQEPGNVEYEVWPRSPKIEVLHFTGSRTIGEMDDDTDTCFLDGDAIVLLAAAEMIAKKDEAGAKLKIAGADKIIRDILHRQIGQKTPDTDLAARPRYRGRAGIDYIAPVA